MKMRVAMAALLGLLCWVSCAVSAAHADDSLEPLLGLNVEPGVVSPSALQQALEAELGLVVASESSPAERPTIMVVRLPSGNVEVSLASRTLPRASREVALTAEIEAERVEILCLIASNLVRNEAASLLPDLRPRLVAGAEPRDAPAASPEPSAELDPCRHAGDRALPGFDFAPGVGSSSTPSGRDGTRNFSLGLVGTLSARLRGFEVSVAVNLKRVSVCGAQLTAGANVVLGPVRGVQLGNFNLATSDVLGAQGASINVSGGNLRGAQAGVVNVVLGEVMGVQGAVTNIALGAVRGAQGGVANYAKDVTGAQLGVANLAIGRLTGAQVGVANVSVEAAEGLQLGAANVSAGPLQGAQLGVFNYAERSDASIGVLSVVRRGRTSVDATFNLENSLVMAGVTHGGKRVHNTYGIGARTGSEGARLAAMMGIGVRALSSGCVRLDFDLTGTRLLHSDLGSKQTMIVGIRAPDTVQFFEGLGAMIAPSFQVMATNDPTEVPDVLIPETTVHRNSKWAAYAYPGLTLGLRWEFDHGV